MKHTYCFDLTRTRGNGLTPHLPKPHGEYQNFYDENTYEVVEMLVRWCSNYIVREAQIWDKIEKGRVRVIFDSRLDLHTNLAVSAILRGLYRWIDEVLWYDVNGVENWDKVTHDNE